MTELDKKESVSVTVLGRTMKLSCPSAEVNYLHRATEEVNNRIKKMKDTGLSCTNDQYLMMVAIELAYDLEKIKNTKPQDEFTEKLKDIQNFLTTALSNNE